MAAKGVSRVVRAKARIALTASRRAETRYASDLRGIMSGVHAGYLKALAPHIRAIAAKGSPVRHDGVTSHGRELDFLGVKVRDHIRKTVGPAFDRMAAEVDRSNKAAAKALIGITPQISVWPQIATFREANIQLMENAAVSYADQARAVLDDPETFGLRVEEIADLLQQRGVASESRAELIARDQTLKLNAQLNETRQRGAGVGSYTWSGSLDNRERESHRALEGQVFSWDAPPVTNEDGDTNHPGEDFQCRCVALPMIEGLEDL